MNSDLVAGLVAVTLTACGGHSHRQPPTGGGARGNVQAGAGPIEESAGGAGNGGAGNRLADAGGAAGEGEGAGTGGVTGRGGSSGQSSTGGRSAAGAGTSAGAGSGGAAGGGAAGGGAPAMAGAGGAPLLEAPPNCQAVSQSEDLTSCNYVYTCSAQTHFSDCKRDSDGIWACDCGTFSDASRNFEVEGIDGLAACGLIARICDSNLPASPTRTCRTLDQSDNLNGDACTAKASCGNVLDVGADGGVVRAVEYYQAQCKASTDYFFTDSFTCACQGGSLDGSSYLTTAPSTDAVCGPVLDFCTTEQAPVFPDQICAYSEPGGIVRQACPANQNCQGCALTQDCALASHLTPDVSLLRENEYPNEYHYVVCLPEQGSLVCSCELSNDGVYSDDTVPASTLELCTQSRAVCPD